MRKIVKGIGSGIGLAAEGIAHHKEKKAAASRSPSGREPSALASDQNPNIGPPRDIPAGEEEVSDDGDFEDDEQAWQLDEAAEGMTEEKEPSQVAERELTVDELVHDFEVHHPPPPAYSESETPTLGRLQCPVVLPQKRPQAKDRGFVRAYAPMLADCGIDQATFLDFLDDFDKSTHASQYITVINMAAGIVGFVPNPILMAVSISVQVAAGTAKALQSRHRTNTFLDQMNDKLFRPHGLFCMLMTYKPEKESSGEPVMVSSMVSKAITPADSKFKQQMKLLRMSSGTTKGEMELPEAAPLIFPALDEAVAANGEKKNAFIRSSKFASNYMDKRSQATYAYQHPDSKLAVPEKPQFASRYSDPNHPANSGSIISLVTGGHINPMARKDRRRESRRERRAGRPLTVEEKRAPKKGIITRYLKQGILYMMIVNMPSQEEMDEAMKIAGVSSGQFEQEDGSDSKVTSEMEALHMQK